MRDGTRKRLGGPKVGINTFTKYGELNIYNGNLAGLKSVASSSALLTIMVQLVL